MASIAIPHGLAAVVLGALSSGEAAASAATTFSSALAQANARAAELVRSATQHVTCETAAAVVYHLRRIGEGCAPVSYSGYNPRPPTLCGRSAAWDSRVPPTPRSINCRACRIAMGWPEMMEAP